MTASTTTGDLRDHALVERRRPSALELGLRRGGLELKMYMRSREAVVFNFLFPLLMLALLGSIFSGEVPGTGVSASQLLVAGVMAPSLMSVSFSNLAISIAVERGEGMLKRLALLPLAPSSYFIGKIAMVLVCAVTVNALTLAMGVVFYDVHLPTEASKWAILAATFFFGVVTCSLLGIAFSGLARTAKAAPAVVMPVFVVLQFISGVWVPLDLLPETLKAIAALFPLRWLVQGMRAALLPDSFLAAEPTGSWQLPLTFAMLVGWSIVSFGICLLTFRWRGRGES
jgi:ABC-2 type transport system permease protein